MYYIMQYKIKQLSFETFVNFVHIFRENRWNIKRTLENIILSLTAEQTFFDRFGRY